MRGIVTVSVLVALAVLSVLAGTPDVGLRPSGFRLQTFDATGLGRSPAQNAAPQSPQAPPQIPPVFRGEVDLIRLDVSVLERDRRPVTGLTANDFTVTEDGVVQKISAFTEVLVPDREPKATAWMRLARVDVASNDLLDQLGDGRPYAIVMDDWNIPAEDLFLVHNSRAAGREVVSRLGPLDVAAVIFVHQTGRTVDFTTDRVKLLDAINGFEGRDRDALTALYLQEADRRRGPPNPLIPTTPSAPWSPGGFGGAASGDMPMRASRILGLSDCELRKPLVPALEVAARRLAMVPNRRKTIALVSIGIALIPGPGCDGVLYNQMNQVYAVAEQANINIYTVDVSDDRRIMGTMLDQRLMFLKDVAEYTGGLVVGANGEPMETSVDRIFAEAGSYYLIGYQSSKGAPNGKFRRIEVRVNRPYVTVRSRNGYFAPTPDGPRVPPEMDRAGLGISSVWDSFRHPAEIAARPPSGNSLALSGLYPPAGLPLRVSAVPIGLAPGSGAREMEIVLALSVRLPPARNALNETVTLIRHIYDPKGRPSPPFVTTQSFAVPPAAGDETRYDFFQRLTLPPGRHEVRLNARSAAGGRDGSVYTVIDVPDVSRAAVTLSGVMLGTVPPADVPRTDPLAPVLPIVPTSARNFTSGETIAAFFRVFQGGTSPTSAVTLGTRILDRRDRPVVETIEILTPDVFADGRGVARQIPLALGEVTPGPYLLSITATGPAGVTARREVIFRVR